MRSTVWRVLALLVVLAGFGSANVILELNHEFSGATPPESMTKPWLTATFTDVSLGVVDLTMEATNLTDTEKVTVWNFNVEPFIGHTFNWVSG
jgi:hypothetical protein